MIINALTGEEVSFEDFFKQLTGDVSNDDAKTASQGDEPADDGMCQIRADIVKSVLDNAELLSCYCTYEVIQSANDVFQYIMTGKVPE